MIICHSRRFIFFSNPKTGSESLRKLLEPWNEETIVPYRQRSASRVFYPHMSPAEAAGAFDAKGIPFDSYTRITCVRNPYTRLVSLYRMIAAVDGVWRLRRQIGMGQPNFAGWLHGTRPDGRGGGGRAHQRWRKYGTWSAQAWCAGRVTHVLRLEHLAQDLPPVLAGLGIAPSGLPRINARPDIDLSDWYDGRTAALVATRYAQDLSDYGYDMPVQLAQAG